MLVRSSFETTGKKRCSDLLLGTLRINVGDKIQNSIFMLRNEAPLSALLLNYSR